MLLVGCVKPVAQPTTPQPTNAPPPGNTPYGHTPPPPGEEPPPSMPIFRFDASGELANPRGELADRQDSAKALRVGFGANLSPNFAFGVGMRFVATSPKLAPGAPERTELFMDLVGMYLRFKIPVAPQLSGFLEAEPALVGMHVPCEDLTSFTCGEDGLEFQPRLGLTGRVGGVFHVVPNSIDLYGYVALETTYPDEGGWLSIGAGVAMHFGKTQADIAAGR